VTSKTKVIHCCARLDFFTTVYSKNVLFNFFVLSVEMCEASDASTVLDDSFDSPHHLESSSGMESPTHATVASGVHSVVNGGAMRRPASCNNNNNITTNNNPPHHQQQQLATTHTPLFGGGHSMLMLPQSQVQAQAQAPVVASQQQHRLAGTAGGRPGSRSSSSRNTVNQSSNVGWAGERSSTANQLLEGEEDEDEDEAESELNVVSGTSFMQTSTNSGSFGGNSFPTTQVFPLPPGSNGGRVSSSAMQTTGLGGGGASGYGEFKNVVSFDTTLKPPASSGGGGGGTSNAVPAYSNSASASASGSGTSELGGRPVRDARMHQQTALDGLCNLTSSGVRANRIPVRSKTAPPCSSHVTSPGATIAAGGGPVTFHTPMAIRVGDIGYLWEKSDRTEDFIMQIMLDTFAREKLRNNITAVAVEQQLVAAPYAHAAPPPPPLRRSASESQSNYGERQSLDMNSAFPARANRNSSFGISYNRQYKAEREESSGSLQAGGRGSDAGIFGGGRSSFCRGPDVLNTSAGSNSGGSRDEADRHLANHPMYSDEVSMMPDFSPAMHTRFSGGGGGGLPLGPSGSHGGVMGGQSYTSMFGASPQMAVAVGGGGGAFSALSPKIGGFSPGGYALQQMQQQQSQMQSYPSSSSSNLMAAPTVDPTSFAASRMLKKKRDSMAKNRRLSMSVGRQSMVGGVGGVGVAGLQTIREASFNNDSSAVFSPMPKMKWRNDHTSRKNRRRSSAMFSKPKGKHAGGGSASELHSTMHPSIDTSHNYNNLSHVSGCDFDLSFGQQDSGVKAPPGHGNNESGCDDVHHLVRPALLNEMNFQVTVIGGVYQQCFDDSYPVVSAPSCSDRRVVDVSINQADDSLVLCMYLPRDKTTKKIELGTKWLWMRCSPTGYLAFRSAIVPGVHSVCYFLPKHPDDWASSSIASSIPTLQPVFGGAFSSVGGGGNSGGKKIGGRRGPGGGGGRRSSIAHLHEFNGVANSLISPTMRLLPSNSADDEMDCQDGSVPSAAGGGGGVGIGGTRLPVRGRAAGNSFFQPIGELGSTSSCDISVTKQPVEAVPLAHPAQGVGMAVGIDDGSALRRMDTELGDELDISATQSCDDTVLDSSCDLDMSALDLDEPEKPQAEYMNNANLLSLVLEYLIDDVALRTGAAAMRSGSLTSSNGDSSVGSNISTAAASAAPTTRRRAQRSTSSSSAAGAATTSSSTSASVRRMPSNASTEAACLQLEYCLRVSKAWSLATYMVIAQRKSSLSWGAAQSFAFDRFTRFVNRYRDGAFLSQGACKDVYAIVNPASNKLEALSVMDMDDLHEREMDSAITQELHISLLCSSLTSLKVCPNLVQVYSLFQSQCNAPAQVWSKSVPELRALTAAPSSGSTAAVVPLKKTKKGSYQYIRMEFCTGGDLEEYVRGQPQAQPSMQAVKSLFFQMCFSLYACREKLSLRHFDVKLLNFFITNGESLLSDGAAAACTGGVADPVNMLVGLGQNVFHLPLHASAPSLVKLADFGTSEVGFDGLGSPITLQQVCVCLFYSLLDIVACFNLILFLFSLAVHHARKFSTRVFVDGLCCETVVCLGHLPTGPVHAASPDRPGAL
jgi:hypothetical protein